MTQQLPPNPSDALAMLAQLVRDYVTSLASRPGTQQCVGIVADTAIRTLNDALKLPDASPPD